MADIKEKQRKRYSPEVRRSMLLDEASTIVVNEGISGLTLERIARQAGVSKSLLYNYFDGVTELLRELHQRELKHLRTAQIKAAEQATTLEEMVRGLTRAYLLFIEERGLIVERLQAEPSVSKGPDPTYYSREAAVEYFAELTAKFFSMPTDLARVITEVSFGLPASAGEYLLRSNMDRQQLEDITVSMILGSILGARNDYFSSVKKMDKSAGRL